jgi:His-Xaa-Ser system protein HxsD
LAVFSLESIKRSAYRFTDRFAVDIHVDGSVASCVLNFDAETSEEMVGRTVAAFQKELLDQDLRAKVREETRDVRNLILAYAFSRTGLTADDTIPAS